MTSTFSDAVARSKTFKDSFGNKQASPFSNKVNETTKTAKEVAKEISQQVAEEIKRQFDKVKKEFDKENNKK